jgi:Zn finger protein HypA/HybF involved in hydrogenase expression
MHDTIISRDIIETARKSGKVNGITVEVGDLGHLPAEELETTLKRMVPEWKIKITKKKAEAKCACGYKGEPKIVEHNHGSSIYICPKCKGIPEITAGQDIILKSVDVL